MTISLDDPLSRHYLEERPTLTYAQPDDPWLVRQMILGIENLFGRRKVPSCLLYTSDAADE